MTRIIGVLSGKGGTTLVANLSTALSMKFNKKTTVIDCNVTTSHLGMHFGVYFYPKTLNDMLKNDAKLEDVILPHNTGVKIIPASLNLSDLIGVDISSLNSKMENLFKDDDFVFLDIAPGFGKEAVSGMKACKEALVVTTPDVPAITDVIRTRTVLDELNIEPIGIVLNKVTKKDFDLTKKEIMDLTGLPIISAIPFGFEVMESIAMKMPLVAYNQTSNVSIQTFKLAALLANESYIEPKPTFWENLGKFFRRLR
jgi:septum site-determining protein MinD